MRIPDSPKYFRLETSCANCALLKDPQAAMALISARPSSVDSKVVTSRSPQENDDDLKRAKELIELHSTINIRFANGIDEDLKRARDLVQKIGSTLS